jgi:hypothetical protein
MFGVQQHLLLEKTGFTSTSPSLKEKKLFFLTPVKSMKNVLLINLHFCQLLISVQI